MNQSTRQHLLLLGISGAVHLLVIVVLLFVARDNTLHKTFIVLGAHSQKPTKALYKPLHNAVPFVGTKAPTTRTKQAKRNRKQTRAAKREQLKIAKKEAALVAEKALPEISSSRKKKSKKKSAVTAKKQAPQVKPTRKGLIKKEELLKTVKTAEKKITKEEEPAIIKLQEEQPPSSAHDEPTAAEDSDEEPLTFSTDEQEYFDPRLYEFHVAIQHEIARTWQPPVGVEKGTEAVGCFVVSTSGEITSFELLSKSNIIIYDLSIKVAAKKCSFDKKLWGKKFIIAFRQ